MRDSILFNFHGVLLRCGGMPMRATRSILLPMLTAAVLTSLPNISHSQQNPELQPITVQLKWAHQFQFAGYYAALHQGFYEEAGLDVTLIEYLPGLTPIDQLMGGRVEFAVADTGALLYRATGVPIVVLAAIFQHSPSVLITRADTGVNTLADLRNRRAMLAGGFMNAELMSMLRQAGITSEDFTLVPGNTSLDVLINGETDAYNGYTTNEPYLLEQRNVPFRVFLPQDYGVDFYGDILITRESLLDSQPEVVANFRQATIRGWEYAVANIEEMVDLIINNYNTQQKSRLRLLCEAQESARLILPNVVPVGYMNMERWQRIESIFRAQGLLDAPVDLAGFVYMASPQDSLWSLLTRYRIAIGITAALIMAALLALHVWRLRALVALRTRELEAARHQAESDARTDALTGLSNRRLFLEGLDRDLSRAARGHCNLALISIDIDHFKLVNDQYGHLVGDEVLKGVATVLAGCARSGDLVARTGGEEFAVICLNTDASEARWLAERMRQQVANLDINTVDARISLTLSLGIAAYQAGDTTISIMARADDALYAAKNRGRNRVICAENADITPE